MRQPVRRLQFSTTSAVDIDFFGDAVLISARKCDCFDFTKKEERFKASKSEPEYSERKNQYAVITLKKKGHCHYSRRVVISRIRHWTMMHRVDRAVG